MGTINKLIQRFRKRPKDFTFNELKRLLNHFGYVQSDSGGSRVVFVNNRTGHKIKLHKPHPGKILKIYQINYIEDELKQKGYYE